MTELNPLPNKDFTWATAGTKTETIAFFKDNGYRPNQSPFFSDLNWRWDAESDYLEWIKRNTLRNFSSPYSAVVDGQLQAGDFFRVSENSESIDDAIETIADPFDSYKICSDGVYLYYFNVSTLKKISMDGNYTELASTTFGPMTTSLADTGATTNGRYLIIYAINPPASDPYIQYFFNCSDLSQSHSPLSGGYNGGGFTDWTTIAPRMCGIGGSDDSTYDSIEKGYGTLAGYWWGRSQHGMGAGASNGFTLLVNSGATYGIKPMAVVSYSSVLSVLLRLGVQTSDLTDIEVRRFSEETLTDEAMQYSAGIIDTSLIGGLATDGKNIYWAISGAPSEFYGIKVTRCPISGFASSMSPTTGGEWHISDSASTPTYDAVSFFDIDDEFVYVKRSGADNNFHILNKTDGTTVRSLSAITGERGIILTPMGIFFVEQNGGSYRLKRKPTGKMNGLWRFSGVGTNRIANTPTTDLVFKVAS